MTLSVGSGLETGDTVIICGVTMGDTDIICGVIGAARPPTRGD
jgi:hypothetical protein